MECCGKTRTTRFCPDCGKALAGGPICGLLDHCRAAESRLLADARRMFHHPPSEERYRRSAAKWRAWIDALEELMANRPGPGGTP